MEELLRGSAPALIAVVVSTAFIGLLLMVRRARNARLAPAEAKPTPRQQRELEFTKQAIAAVAPPAKRLVHPEVIAEAIEDFDLAAVLQWAHDLFERVQRGRLGDPGAFEQELLPGAREVAFAAGPGLEATGQVWLLSTQVVKANGTVDGCDLRLVFTALLEETRSGEPVLTEVCEEWRFGWPPATRKWRVLQVERRWRRRCEAPVVNPDRPEPAAKEVPAPDLAEATERHGIDFEAVQAAALLALEGWADAITSGTHTPLEGLTTPAFLEGRRGEIHRNAAGHVKVQWSTQVAAMAPTRAMSDGTHRWAAVRATGHESIRVDVGQTIGTPHRMSWALTLELRDAGDGHWLLDSAIDDDAWVV